MFHKDGASREAFELVSEHPTVLHNILYVTVCQGGGADDQDRVRGTVLHVSASRMLERIGLLGREVQPKGL